MTPTDIAVAALRWLEYAGLLGFIGLVVVRRIAANPPAIQWARAPMHIALAAAFGGGVGVVASTAIQASASLSAAAVVRVVAEGVALTLCLSIGRGAVPVGMLAVVALAFGGHATRIQPPTGAVFVDVVHILSAGMWAGGIVVLATLRPPDGWRSGEGRALLERFGRVAVLAFAITALTGLLRATEELSGVRDLWTTAYGLVLSAKSMGVLAMLAMSALAWRRRAPLARAEASAALAVIAATAVLAAYPMPPTGA